ncbi:hypothetical protein PHYBOEH_005132 [Phytophthora boehmeriae]|uniref:Uncharacterized protein n=1 Tax=Phytophthora boehmeriae TaxID=109152 RepID=A0A8T1XA26_9STRA|nr:hypothetical protein PHYBOEH_005132 [Phytophthora boehmeriae]
MGKTKKRQRSESFQGEQPGADDARKRLAAFHARMFELPSETPTASAVTEMPRVQWKQNGLKRKSKKAKRSAEEEESEAVPVVKFNRKKDKKKEQKKQKTAVGQQEQQQTKKHKTAAIKVPGMSNTPVKTGVFKKNDKQTTAHQVNSQQKVKQKHQHKKQKSQQQVTVTTPAATSRVQVKVSVQAPQWHSMSKNEEQEDDDGVDPLEQALVSVRKEIVNKQVTTPPRKKQKVKNAETAKTKQTGKNVTKGDEAVGVNGSHSPGVGANSATDDCHLTTKIKEHKRLQNATATVRTEASGKAHKDALKAVKKEVSGSEAQEKTEVVNSPATIPSPKTRKKRKRKSPKVNTTITPSPKTTTSAPPRKGKPLVVSDHPEDIVKSDVKTTNAPPISASPKKRNMELSAKPNVSEARTTKKTDTVLGKSPPSEPITKNTNHASPPSSPMPSTQIGASLAEDIKRGSADMFLPANNIPSPVLPPQKESAVARSKKYDNSHLMNDSASESEDSDDFDGRSNDASSLFSRLIDSAARERWELMEVGRLVRLFAAEWNFKQSKTADFLVNVCPELVSVDFLEGLGINLSAKQLLRVFEEGSGNSGVLMNKMASAVENGHLSVRDPSFVAALEKRVALMETNIEVMELLHPLLESLSTVRDVGCLLKQLCRHWQPERTIALVQQVLLSNVFDDLDGNQDEILIDLPHLKGRLDFPSRLHQDDVDENGNLVGFLANDDSELSGEEGSEEEPDEVDSDEDDDHYDGETDSEEEDEISGQSRSRSQFIDDEADVGEEDEEEDEEELEETRGRDDDDSSSSDSD